MTWTIDLAQAFLVPKNTAHRQYEALRAFYVKELPPEQVAQRFGYSDGAFSFVLAAWIHRAKRFTR